MTSSSFRFIYWYKYLQIDVIDVIVVPLIVQVIASPLYDPEDVDQGNGHKMTLLKVERIRESYMPPGSLRCVQ